MAGMATIPGACGCVVQRRLWWEVVVLVVRAPAHDAFCNTSTECPLPQRSTAQRAGPNSFVHAGMPRTDNLSSLHTAARPTQREQSKHADQRRTDQKQQQQQSTAHAASAQNYSAVFCLPACTLVL